MSAAESVSNALSSIVSAARSTSSPAPGVNETDLALGIFMVAFYFSCLFVAWVHSLKDLWNVGRPKFLILSILLFTFALWNVTEAWILIFQWLHREYNDAWFASGGSDFLRNHPEASAATGVGGEFQFNWAKWFVDFPLFVTAYEMVVETFSHWFWSSQLLHFVPSLVLFTYVEFYRAGAKRPFSNFLLGCLAAISLCFPYVLHVSLNTKRAVRRSRSYIPVGRFLIVCLLVATVSSILLPRTTENFGLVLAVLHGSLLAPLLFAQLMPREFFGSPVGAASATPTTTTTPAATSNKAAAAALDAEIVERQKRDSGAWWVVITYSAFGGMAAVIHLMNLLVVVGNLSASSMREGGGAASEKLLSHLMQTFCANECQCSISNDVARTSAVFMLVLLWFTLFHGSARRYGEHGTSRTTNMLLFVLTPILSVGATFPIWAALREAHFLLNPLTYEERVMAMIIHYFEPSTYMTKDDAKKNKRSKSPSKRETPSEAFQRTKQLDRNVRSLALKVLAPYVAGGREEVLIRGLVAKHGMEPRHMQQIFELTQGGGVAPQAQQAAATAGGGGAAAPKTATTPEAEARMKKFLTQFYIAQGKPEKCGAAVDEIVVKWRAHGEAHLYRAIKAKYPEAFDGNKIIVKKRKASSGGAGEEGSSAKKKEEESQKKDESQKE